MTPSTKENPGPSETDGTSRRRSRRQLLALGGAAAAAAAVAAVGVNGGKKAHAGVGDPLTLGQVNDSGTQGTLVSADLKTLVGGPNEPASTLALENTATALGCDEVARALVAESAGEAILAITWGGAAGVRGCSGSLPDWGPGIGVAGISGSGVGVAGDSESGVGVAGACPSGVGVLGRSDTGTGVEGLSHAGIGVYAQAAGDVPAVRAVSAFFGAKGGCGAPPPDGEASIESNGGVVPDGGLALDVVGKAAFSTAGTGVIASNADAATVDNEAVTAESHITVTLMGNPGQARVVWVERQPGIGFVVHTASVMASGAPASGGRGGGQPAEPASGGNSSGWDVPFTYLIVEPGA